MYEDLTDAELDTKIAELRGKYEDVLSGGAAVVIAGEGRRVEYTRGNIDGLEKLLDLARSERTRRANGGRFPNRAIRVRHIY